MISSKLIAKTLYSLVEDDKKNPREVADKFALFAEAHNLMHYMSPVARAIEAEYRRRQKKNQLSIRVACEISGKLLEQIKQYVGASKEVETERVVDKDIIGGFVARYGNMIYDGSMRTQLKKLRAKLVAKDSKMIMPKHKI
jgi:F0F1-type ATP synthase delta subunit